MDLENRTLRVSTKGGVKAPIALPDKCAELLGKWVQKNPSASPWLFPSPRNDSGHISISYISHRFNALAKRAKIGRRIWLHGLRHSFATRMLNAGMSLPSVQRQLCHSTPTMTLRYARVSLGRVQEEMRAATG